MQHTVMLTVSDEDVTLYCDDKQQIALSKISFDDFSVIGIGNAAPALSCFKFNWILYDFRVFSSVISTFELITGEAKPIFQINFDLTKSNSIFDMDGVDPNSIIYGDTHKVVYLEKNKSLFSNKIGAAEFSSKDKFIVKVLNEDFTYFSKELNISRVIPRPHILDFNLAPTAIHKGNIVLSYNIEELPYVTKQEALVKKKNIKQDSEVVILSGLNGLSSTQYISYTELQGVDTDFILYARVYVGEEYKDFKVGQQKVLQMNNKPTAKIVNLTKALYEIPFNINLLLSDLDNDEMNVTTKINGNLVDYVSSINTNDSYKFLYAYDDLKDNNSLSVVISDTIDSIKLESTIYKKTYDSIGYDGASIDIGSDIFNVKPLFRVLYKWPEVDISKGYIKSYIAKVNIVSINSDININIYPVLDDWSSAKSTTFPEIATMNKLQTLSSAGEVELDLYLVNSAFYAKYGKYPKNGFAIISQGVFSLKSYDSSVDIQYQKTFINQPEIVYHNSVFISWQPYLLADDEVFDVVVIERDISKDFSSSVNVYSSDNIDSLSFTDLKISKLSSCYYRAVVYTSKGHFVSNPVSIEVPIPPLGYDYELNSSKTEYVLRLHEGLFWDSIESDYDFYSSPEGYFVKYLDMGALIGGLSSGINGVELINSFHEVISVKLFVIFDNQSFDFESGSLLLPDSEQDENKTKIEISLTKEPFDLISNSKFTMASVSKQNFYIRITPQRDFDVTDTKLGFVLVAKRIS